MKTCIVYSISFVEAVGCYLPSAYIAEVKSDKLGYMQKMATEETIQSYALEWQGTPHEVCFKSINLLQPEQLEIYFNKGKKRGVTLSKLFQEDAGKKMIIKKVEREMQIFLNTVSNNTYPICFEVERKVVLEDIRLKFVDYVLEPKLRFVKTQTGLNYELTLDFNNKKIRPYRHDTHIILNDPAWIIVDYHLLHVSAINGNKITPFLKKEFVFIPERIQKDYFEKFIKDIIGKVDSEVEGFELIENEFEPNCKLYFVEDLLTGKLILSPVFHYGSTQFIPHDKAPHRVDIKFDSGKPLVTIIKRNLELEKKLLNGLTSLGLTLINGRITDGKEDIFSIVQWWANHSKEIDTNLYSLPTPSFKGHTINLSPYTIEFSFSKGVDWFDLHGIITIGAHQVIFADLLNCIAKDDRFFLLPDGTEFIIPQSWMAKYGKMAKFAKHEKGKIKLATSQYMLLEDLDEVKSKSVKDYRVEALDLDFKISPLLKATLRPYQFEGAKWLATHYENGFGALLADDMGLGKTLQTLAVLLYAKERIKQEPTTQKVAQLSLFESTYANEINPLKALIIMPSSLVFNWQEEIKKFAPTLNIALYQGSHRNKIDVKNFDIILTTYHTAANDVERLLKVEFSYIVLDESHYIKNRSTKLFTNINRLKSDYKISLSGTPIENSLSDLFTQMEFINPEILGNYSFFREHFQLPIEKFKNEEALLELNNLIEPFIKRRTKREVLHDLPELSEHIVYSEMLPAQKKLFEDEKSAARNYLLGIEEGSGSYKIHVFNMLLRLRKIANHPRLFDVESKAESGKYADVTNYIDSIVRSDNKVLVFSSFLDHIKMYETYCEENEIGYETLTGKTPSDKREKVVNSFKNNADKKIFFISLKAGGVGLNLVEASYVLILDPWWNPFAEKQAIGRAHRIGQEEKVIVTRFISKDSIEEKILKLQQEKLSVAGSIIDLGDTPTLDKKELNFLFD